MMRRNKRKLIVRSALVVTAIWLVLAGLIVVFWSERCPDVAEGAEWAKLYLDCRAPNEIGDFLAGIFATLAFVWLMVAVFIQSMELAAQREELELTRTELMEHRKVAQAQVELIEEQTEMERSKDRARFTMIQIGRDQRVVKLQLSNTAATAYAIEVFYHDDKKTGRPILVESDSFSFSLTHEEFRNFDISVGFVDRRDRRWLQRFSIAPDNSIISSAPTVREISREPRKHSDDVG